jgi:hypothetical protein
MEDLSWKDDSYSVGQKIPYFKEYKESSPCSQNPGTGPYPEQLNPVYTCTHYLSKEFAHVYVGVHMTHSNQIGEDSFFFKKETTVIRNTTSRHCGWSFLSVVI